MKTLNLVDFIPRKLGHRDVFVSEKGEYLLINCNKVRPPRPIKIKKKIVLDSNFLEVIGLYFGDGANSKSGSGNRRIALANSCVDLHRKFLNFLFKFGVEKTSFRAQMQIGKNIKISKEELIDYWSESLDLPKECFQEKIGIKDAKTKEKGLLVLNYNSKIFRVLFDNLFDYCLELCKENKKAAAGFIRGLFAAEGYVSVNKYNSLAWLDLPIIDKNRRKFVFDLFKSLGIKSRDNGKRLIVTGYLNFKKCKELDLIKYHLEKAEKFNLAYENLIEKGNVPALTKLKIIGVLEKGNKTRFEISELLNIDISTIYKSLKDLEIKSIVRLNGKSFSRNNRKLCALWTLEKIPKNEFDLMNSDYCKKREIITCK
ncbi:MAG: hypothetical protein KKH88_01565 [Nanoarchaeota archaeon]|nr:hypothetical protein [Nanoarchaeota archaeon]MBU1445437.1 hypothetical protein [Nanoarchaeota archaeon]MBU2406963.1 hypothetical protein [Nanoarchaeota archaeon]MBU2420245.1 hypothetical protein [Nanoarchaeota archaeon]MBU2474992.1 hypothetical protein [Nanoarchaeota archaeon]